MTATTWLFVALTAIGGVAIGLLLGLWRTMALTRELAVKDASCAHVRPQMSSASG